MGVKVSLKTQNLPLVSLFLSYNIIIYILCITGIKDFWNDLSAMFTALTVKDGFLMTILPIISFVAVHFINPNYKAMIVFWRIKNPLPGCRAFSEIGPKDPRVDMDFIKTKITIPTEPKEQNKSWYKLFKKVEGSTMIDTSHKNFLLARELASISLLFLICMPWTVFFFNNNYKDGVIYILICFVQFLILCKVGQHTGERFTANVLAEYSCKEIRNEEVLSK